MNQKNRNKFIIIVLLLAVATIGKIKAQDPEVPPVPILSVNYFLSVNKIPYIEINTKKKVGRKFEPVTGIPVNVYFNEATGKNLLGKIITDNNGNGELGLPPSFKSTWDSLNEFKLVAVSDSSAGNESLNSEVTIKKAILVVDTALIDGTRTVTAQLKEKSGNDWVAVRDIEMKLAIKRSLGNLSVGDAVTYTADSTGLASADFKKDSMPGDEKGNLVLVASVEDNDSFGNLVAEKVVPWGVVVTPNNNFFNQRTLWSTRFRTPLWLLLVAYSIVIGVWGTMIYLVFQLIKIKKLGKEYERKNTDT